MEKGIALDLGSSGFRALAVDISDGELLAGACTLSHPLPGSNVIDHILFSLTYSRDLAHSIIIKTVNRLIKTISKTEEVELLAACGNPIQLGLLTNGELRDLAYSPDALRRKGISVPRRDGRILDAGLIGIDVGCDILIPPSIKAEVGADAVAMICKSGLLREKVALAVDFGTNAEMAIKSDKGLFVGSAAAGPAIEGQHIRRGMLASPGAICDLAYDWGWKCMVLDENMMLRDGDTVDLTGGKTIEQRGIRAAGITGTGVIALVSIGLGAGFINSPCIVANSGKLTLQDGIDFDENDLQEAGKAFGAIRAGEETLAKAAGVSLNEIETCFMSGAAGTFSDPQKARDLELIPACIRNAILLGNTSLEMAEDLVSGKETLEGMQEIADRAEHISFSGSETFKQYYLREYAYWCEGAQYSGNRTGRPTAERPAMKIVKAREREPKITTKYFLPKYYIPCSKSQERIAQVCPKNALLQRDGSFELDLRRCLGPSCLRCERAGAEFRLGVEQDASI